MSKTLANKSKAVKGFASVIALVLFCVTMVIGSSKVTSAISIDSLSQTEGYVEGGDSITINGDGFIEDIYDKVVKIGSTGHTVAKTGTGSVYAWGNNSSGQLGLGDNSYRTEPVDITNIISGERVVDFGVGGNFTILLTESGKVFACGNNSNGTLGIGSTVGSNVPVEITSSFGGENIVEIYSSEFHNIAVSDSGKVFAWGANWGGQLGTGDNANKNVPTEITSIFGGKTIKSIYIGGVMTFALMDDGTLLAWGENNKGQLGDGGTTAQVTPIDITAQFADTIDEMFVGMRSVFAKDVNGNIYAWGENNEAQLGTGDRVDVPSPIDVTANFPEPIDSIHIGHSSSVALATSGKVIVWGSNWFGQLGLPQSTVILESPTDSGLAYTSAILAAGNNSTYLASDEGVFAWGYNLEGQVGNDSTTNQYGPAEITSSFNLPLVDSISQIDTIHFGDVEVVNFTVVDANTIRLTVPAHAAGVVNVTIKDISGAETTLASGYEYKIRAVNAEEDKNATGGIEVPNTGAAV